MLRVLLVEDNPVDVYLVRQAIRKSPTSAELIVATDGDKARQMIADDQPDLIILDLVLPRHGGLKILAEYRAGAGPPVIVLTGSDSPVHRERALALGAREYIVKSMHLQEFDQSIHAALERWLPPPSETRTKAMEHPEILHALKSELAAARQKANEATKKFEEAIGGAPGGPPHDGAQRIRNASRELSIAREQLVEAHVRLNAFVAQGIVPDHLKNGKEREEGPDSARKSAGQSEIG
jgi:DNA-binding NarL/FixJ family response regulator